MFQGKSLHEIENSQLGTGEASRPVAVSPSIQIHLLAQSCPSLSGGVLLVLKTVESQLFRNNWVLSYSPDRLMTLFCRKSSLRATGVWDVVYHTVCTSLVGQSRVLFSQDRDFGEDENQNQNYPVCFWMDISMALPFVYPLSWVSCLVRYPAAVGMAHGTNDLYIQKNTSYRGRDFRPAVWWNHTYSPFSPCVFLSHRFSLKMHLHLPHCVRVGVCTVLTISHHTGVLSHCEEVGTGYSFFASACLAEEIDSDPFFCLARAF